eukprot:m.151232 g.151232  ORF g.151232 m.151232 type:complete len:168 (-) comp10152_c0_seq5:2003-2506(-)
MCFAAPWPPASTWPALTTSCPSRQPMTAKSCCAITASTSRNQALTCPSLTLDLFQARRALRSILAHVLFVLQLVEIGPSAQLTIRRIKHAPAELEKQALKVPRALKPKKKKNVSYTEMGDKMGRIHMQSQASLKYFAAVDPRRKGCAHILLLLYRISRTWLSCKRAR